MQGTMPGARRRGRPRTAWRVNIKTWTGLPVEDSIRMTEDRDKWRKYVHWCGQPSDRGRLKNTTERRPNSRQTCIGVRVKSSQHVALQVTHCCSDWCTGRNAVPTSRCYTGTRTCFRHSRQQTHRKISL